MRLHYPLNTQGAEDAGQLPWTDGVPSTGAQGSYPGHSIVTDAEAEILAAIDAAGLARSGSDLTQLIQGVSRGIFLGTFTGSANALIGAIPNSVVFPSLLQGMRFSGIATTANSAAVTITLTGFKPAVPSLPLLRRDGGALAAADLPLNAPFSFRFDGSAFRLDGPPPSEILDIIRASGIVPIIAKSSTTLFVRSDGSDANNGSANDAAHAFLTPAAAIAYGLSRFSLVGGALNIQLGIPGTYPAPGGIPATIGTVVITGDPANPAGYVLSGSASISPLFAQGAVTTNGVRLVNNCPGAATATASANGFLSVYNTQFATNVTATGHISAGNTGIIAVGAGCSILTGAQNALAAVTSGNVQINATVTLLNNPGFTSAFAFASSNGSIGVTPGAGFTGTPGSGVRYIVGLNGTINTSGGGANFFPGDQAGINTDGTGAYA